MSKSAFFSLGNPLPPARLALGLLGCFLVPLWAGRELTLSLPEVDAVAHPAGGFLVLSTQNKLDLESDEIVTSFSISHMESGQRQWMHQVRIFGTAQVQDLEATSAGKTVIGGRFSGRLQIGDETLVSAGRNDFFLLWFSEDGTLEQSLTIGSLGRTGSISVGPGSMGSTEVRIAYEVTNTHPGAVFILNIDGEQRLQHLARIWVEGGRVDLAQGQPLDDTRALETWDLDVLGSRFLDLRDFSLNLDGWQPGGISAPVQELPFRVGETGNDPPEPPDPTDPPPGGGGG